MQVTINGVEFPRSALSDESSFMDRAMGLPDTFFEDETTLLDLGRHAPCRFLVAFIRQRWNRWRALEIGLANDRPDLVEAAIDALYPTRVEIRAIMSRAGPRVRAHLKPLEKVPPTTPLRRSPARRGRAAADLKQPRRRRKKRSGTKPATRPRPPTPGER